MTKASAAWNYVKKIVLNIRFEKVRKKIDGFGANYHIQGELDIELDVLWIATLCKLKLTATIESWANGHTKWSTDKDAIRNTRDKLLRSVKYFNSGPACKTASTVNAKTIRKARKAARARLGEYLIAINLPSVIGILSSKASTISSRKSAKNFPRLRVS